MLGDETSEYRNYPTDVRGVVSIYASAMWYSEEEEQEMQSEFSLNLDSLPHSVIVGAVEAYDCQQGTDGGYEWLLRSPPRIAKPLIPKGKPEPS